MKSIWFHLQGYRDLPDDFAHRYDSSWVTPPNRELCDPEQVRKYLHWNLDELEYADDLGFDGIGTNEHHSNVYGFPISPLITAGVLARRNSDAAICILGTTLPTANPLRIAEEVAWLDCMSGGRMVAGVPVGSSMDTCGVAGLPPTQVRPRWYEGMELIRQAWTRPGPFPFNGRFNKYRYVNPWPTPLQKPYPPMWLLGGGSLETYDYAAKYDLTYSYLSFQGAKYAKALMQGFWDVIEQAGLDDNPYRGGFAQVVAVADSDREAERLYAKHVENFYEKSVHIPPHLVMVPGYMTKKSLQAVLKKSAEAGIVGFMPKAEMTYADAIETGAVIAGSPDTVAEQLIDAVTGLRVGHLILLMQIQSMPTELTKYSTRLFADKVLPRLRDLWADYEDHWWPTGATRNQSASAALTGEATK
jgi:alkanesulfonate monooxygenase SsuD/methylene tetrahydromethanopterin reductase-like flavin-dependent oxidoreductase (luciferase family)